MPIPEYSLSRSSRRRTMAIEVKPDLSINVIAPLDTREEHIAATVLRRKCWIGRQQAYFRRYHPLPGTPRFVAGETHYLLGRQFRLRIAERMPSTMVGMIGEYIEVLLRGSMSKEAVERALAGWYRAEAERVLREAFDRTWTLVRKHDIPRPTLKLRAMAGRWGSCTRSGTILLNPKLVQVPIHCVDYVLIHELCHLRHHDHGKAFYRLLGSLAPDWKTLKRKLEGWTEVIWLGSG